MGRGVNILGYDAVWKNPKKARFQEKHFQLIREAGFETVRINLHALQRMGKAPIYKLPEAWLATLDWAVESALAAGLNVILDLHNFNDVAKDPPAFKPRLTAFWKQIGERYKDKPEALVFEILNEPNGKLDAAALERLARRGPGRHQGGESRPHRGRRPADVERHRLS